MMRFGSVVLLLLVSLTVSLPTCNVSYWVNSNAACSGSPNGTHSALVYNGNCTTSPDILRTISYKLIIDAESKAVQTFTVYKDNACTQGDEMLVTKTPLALSICGPLLFITTPNNSVRMGSLIFNCQD